MPIVVNGYELTDADVAAELPHHQDTDNPVHSATTAAILRLLLLEDAVRRNIEAESPDGIIDALLKVAVPATAPDDEECRRHYAQNPQRFTVGELVEASHILFQVTPDVDLEALRKRAEKTLAELLEHPELFSERAAIQSNCPSGEVGGSLGQLSRGDTVPEFEKIVFSMPAGSIFPRLVETRFGLHIMQVARRVEGCLLPYESVSARIAEALIAIHRDTAWRQYMKLLVAQARIEGIELEGAETPLVQ